MNPATSISGLLVLALVALVLGMRHGIDADHLAAIDAMTRCNAHARPALACRTGLWFSIGHGLVVLVVAFGVALTAHAWAAPGWLEPGGAWASIAMLVLLGVMCIAISGISLGTAALGAAAQLSPVVAGWAELHSALLALAIVAIVGASFLAGLALARGARPLTIA